jgi:hypothetical protein
MLGVFHKYIFIVINENIILALMKPAALTQSGFVDKI